VCECAEAGAISNATVYFQNNAPQSGLGKEVLTDSKGYFRAPNVSDGRYDITVSARGYDDAYSSVEVRHGSSASPFTIGLGFAPIVVTRAAYPIYPKAALDSRTVGDVIVHLVASGRAQGGAGSSPTLRAAAVSNAETWRFRDPLPKDGLDVMYRFEIHAGDCVGYSPAKVKIDFPGRVEIVGCR
jgi:hypothetical protein